VRRAPGSRRPGLPGIAAGLALALCLPASPAFSLEGDTEQPIHITTDEALRDEKSGRTVYQGNVELVQGTIRIRADKITFYSENIEADRIVAEGNPARMQQQPEPDSPLMHARGKVIEYFRSEERIEVRQNAEVEQDGSTVRGDKIDYFINEQLVKAAADTAEPNSRVKVVIPPHRLKSEEAEQPASSPEADTSVVPEQATTTDTVSGDAGPAAAEGDSAAPPPLTPGPAPDAATDTTPEATP
jgi:lipopolysaccharide export system protein LptA